MDTQNPKKNIKTKKCQPAAGDMPDLIQTEHVPNSWLTRPTKKSTAKPKNKKYQIAKKISQEIGQMTNCTNNISQTTVSTKQKTKKCQPAAGDMPDLIQTEHVPSSWLARPTQKNNKKPKNQKQVKISQATGQMTKPTSKVSQTVVSAKKITKKCQPAAGDMPDLIQTAHVPNSWLARPTKKNTKIPKIQKYYMKRIRVTNSQAAGPMTRISNQSSQKTVCAKTKTKKCQPAAGDMPDLIQTEHVPNSWLARPTKKSTKKPKNQKCHKKKNRVKNSQAAGPLTRYSEQSSQLTGCAKTKTKKCQPAAGDMPDLIQTEHVPNSRLAHPTKKKIKKQNQNQVN